MASIETIPTADSFPNPGAPNSAAQGSSQRPIDSSQRVLTPYWKPSIPVPRPPHVEIGIRFGNRIRELRQKRSMTQVKVAKEFGVDRSYISDLERGKKSISIHTMEIFALGFSMTLSELLDGI